MFNKIICRNNNLQIIFMSEKKLKKEEKKVLGNIGFSKPQDLEQDQNLIGFFSILLDEARRVNPEKYLEGYRKNI